MKTQLIKLQDKFKLVNDEEIKEGEWMMFNSSSVPVQCTKNDGTTVYHKHGHYDTEGTLKVISENPDFSLLSEEDCKRIGWVDVEKLSEKYASKLYYPVGNSKSELNWVNNHKELINVGFIEGFKTAQSLNDKMFSLEDMKEAIAEAWNSCEDNEDGETFTQCFNRIIQSLQKTSWDVEVEMEEVLPSNGNVHDWNKPIQPKITDGSIKILKVL